jgi:hypothetical protein
MKSIFTKIKVVVILLVIFMSACSDDAILQNEPESVYNKTSLELALERADAFFKLIGEDTRTSRKVATIHSVTQQTTRGSIDTLLYLVNYDANKGYALLGANLEINDIYAIAPVGNLTYEDFNNNQILGDFLNSAIAYTLTPPTIDGTLVGWKYWGYKIDEYTPPMLSSYVSSWTQLAPYNAFVQSGSSNQIPVGCVPLSLGMFLSYYEQPTGIVYLSNNKYFKFDWDVMLYDSNTQKKDVKVAEMLKFLGESNLLNTTYSDKGSSTMAKRLIPTLTRLGYNNVLFNNNNLKSRFDSIVAFMTKGKTLISGSKTLKYSTAPLICLGRNLEDTTIQHAWIIDGIVTRSKYPTDSNGYPIHSTSEGVPLISQKLLPLWHCVWGQVDKKNDGWYVFLKDQNNLDSVQYNPFSNKLNSEGLCPTDNKMYRRYGDWTVTGGCKPQ